MANYHSRLVADEFYHIFNRAVGSEKLFFCKEDYYLFLRMLKRHLFPVADLFGFSFIPNHFHLLMRIKPQHILEKHFEKVKRKPFVLTRHDMPDFIMERISNWLNGYVKVFNEKYERKGGLFIDYTKRVEAKTEADIISFLLYIHQNAVHRGLGKEIGNWPFDSYNVILGSPRHSLVGKEIFEWFGSKERFIEFHQQPIQLRRRKDLERLIGEF